MTSAEPYLPETLAAIDLGSNSFHMIVAHLEESGTLSVIDRLRWNVRLGAGLDEHGIIDQTAQERAFACLETFAQRIRDLPQSAVRIAGTNTLRVAQNAAAFVSRAEEILQHPIEIIGGREEARLIYLGVAHGLAAGEGRRLVVDIGGGSTELIIGQGLQPLHRESMYTGCVSISRHFFSDGTLSTKNFNAAETEARLVFFSQAASFNARHWNEAIGCSGTIKAIRNIVNKEGWCLDSISYKSLKQLRRALIEAGHIDALQLAGLSDNRRPVLAGGLCVLMAVFETLNIEQMQVSDQSMREGLLYDLVGRITHHDVRDATVETAISKWGIDAPQAKRVTDTVAKLFDASCQQWSLDSEALRPLLLWAAMLHEVGLQISHNNYHKHGAYILRNADLQGFSRQEQALLAALVLSHRSKFRGNEFKQLMKPFARTGARMCVLLRLSVLLHRGRTEQQLPNITIDINGNTILLSFPPAWLDDHSMTLADLIKEVNYLHAAGFQLHFE